MQEMRRILSLFFGP